MPCVVVRSSTAARVRAALSLVKMTRELLDVVVGLLLARHRLDLDRDRHALAGRRLLGERDRDRSVVSPAAIVSIVSSSSIASSPSPTVTARPRRSRCSRPGSGPGPRRPGRSLSCTVRRAAGRERHAAERHGRDAVAVQARARRPRPPPPVPVRSALTWSATKAGSSHSMSGTKPARREARARAGPPPRGPRAARAGSACVSITSLARKTCIASVTSWVPSRRSWSPSAVAQRVGDLRRARRGAARASRAGSAGRRPSRPGTSRSLARSTSCARLDPVAVQRVLDRPPPGRCRPGSGAARRAGRPAASTRAAAPPSRCA